jgi:hypothetical protein
LAGLQTAAVNSQGCINIDSFTDTEQHAVEMMKGNGFKTSPILIVGSGKENRAGRFMCNAVNGN